MQVQLKYGNFMVVDGQVLTPNDGECLSSILVEHRQLLLDGMARLHTAGAAMPSIWVMQLGPRQTVVCRTSSESEAEIFRDREAIEPSFWPLWDRLLEAQFAPEVRWGTAMFGAEAGMYLLVRLPE